MFITPAIVFYTVTSHPTLVSNSIFHYLTIIVDRMPELTVWVRKKSDPVST